MLHNKASRRLRSEVIISELDIVRFGSLLMIVTNLNIVVGYSRCMFILVYPVIGLLIIFKHEKYSTAIANNYYRDASAVLICFSLADRNTFIQALDVFIKDCLKYEALLRHTVFYLVGNKSDLNSERKVQRSEIEVLN